MFGLKEPLNSHIINVLRTYFKDRQSGQTAQIMAGAKIFQDLLNEKNIRSSLRAATQQFPLPKEGETVGSILSRDFLSTEIGSELLDKAPLEFDFTTLLLGFIHYHVPSFKMAYERDELQKAPSLNTLQLFNVSVDAYGNCKLAFADVSLTISQLKRFSMVSMGSAEVVSLYDEDALVEALTPIFEKYGIKIEYTMSDHSDLVSPITFKIPKHYEPSDLMNVLASLVFEGITLKIQSIPSEFHALYYQVLTEKLVNKYIEKPDLTFSLNVLEQAQVPPSESRSELLAAIMDEAIEKGDSKALRRGYALLSENEQAQMASTIAEHCMISSYASLRKQVAFFLTESGLDPSIQEAYEKIGFFGYPVEQPASPTLRSGQDIPEPESQEARHLTQ